MPESRQHQIGDSVVFTDATGKRHAAIITNEVPGHHADLVVFNYAGQAAFPLRDVPCSHEGAGDSWGWRHPSDRWR